MNTLNRIPTRTLDALFALGVLLLVAALVLIAFKAGYVGYYHGLNTGVTVGGYGLEISGPDGMGFFTCAYNQC